jgi:GAF domain-containing protein
MPKMLIVPLVSGGETVGILSMGTEKPKTYTRRDMALAEKVGRQIAGPVANAQVYVECKRVEEAVREAVERLDLAIWGSGDGLWDWKISEDEVWWSPRFKELVGFQDDKGDGGTEYWKSHLHPEDRERVLGARSRTTSSAESRMR